MLNDLVTDFQSQYKITKQDEMNYQEIQKHTAKVFGKRY